MKVLTIRAHKRFGVCRAIRLRRSCAEPLEGLLIELSLEGCRISSINSDLFALDDRVTVEVEGRPFDACVRWHQDGMLGLRLTQPLRHAELAELIQICRVDPVPMATRRA